MAGFGDGAVRIYDRRLAPRDSMVKVWKEHKAWIVKVHMQRGGMRELVSGSATGEVKLWDIRMDNPVRGFLAHTKGMRSLSVHEHAPIIATYNNPILSVIFLSFFIYIYILIIIHGQWLNLARCETLEHLYPQGSLALNNKALQQLPAPES